jgi:hypothetical protein
MTSSNDQEYLLKMAQISVLGNPNEYTAYGLITEAFILHKQPHNRYTIFPQFFIPWNPKKKDSRGNIPDFVLGLYSDSPPHVRIQGGVEIKKATPRMIQLPPTNVISEDRDIQNTFRSCRFQAEDQAKAAVKGNHIPNEKLLWLMFIGPYFTILELGPFSDDQLITRGHNPNASGDFYESLVVALEKKLEPIEREVYLLGTLEAAEKLEFFINTTSRFLT